MPQTSTQEKNNKQVTPAKIDIYQLKNTAGLTVMYIAATAAPLFLATTIASILLCAKVVAVAALPASLGFLALFANPIAIFVLLSAFVYCTAQAVSSYQQMSKNETVAMEIADAKTLAEGAKKVIEEATKQAREAGIHSKAAEQAVQNAKAAKEETVNEATEAAKNAAQALVNGAGKKFIDDTVKQKAEEIASTEATKIVAQKAKEAVDLAVKTKDLVDMKTFHTTLSTKAENNALNAVEQALKQSVEAIAKKFQDTAGKDVNLVTGLQDLQDALNAVTDKSKSGIAQKLETLKTLVDTINTSVNDKKAAGLAQELETLNTLVSTLNTNVGNGTTGLTKQVNDLEGVVGKHDNEGLRKEAADLKATVGDGTKKTGLFQTVTANENAIADLKNKTVPDLTNKVTALETSVGNPAEPGVAQELKKLGERLNNEFVPKATFAADLKTELEDTSSEAHQFLASTFTAK